MASLSPKKAKKEVPSGVEKSPFEVESSLALPEPLLEEEDIAKTTILTNRAPLVLAFAVTVIKYTMPEQPLSNRLSLAQGVVSANSHSKAVSLGIEKSKSAEDEGWGQGQPTVKVMGREIRVLKRWGYNGKEGAPNDNPSDGADGDTVTSRAEKDVIAVPDEPPALWGLDLDALRKSNDPVLTSGRPAGNNKLPIYTSESARAYLLKSFSLDTSEDSNATKPPKKKTFALSVLEKEKCLGALLRAIDLLCESWAATLSRGELDRRAWSWYLHVRPEVQSGPAGWGQKGPVELAKILDLRKQG